MVITKLLFQNPSVLKNSNSYKLSKKSKIGSVFLSFLVASSVVASQTSKIENNVRDSIPTAISVSMDSDDINQLNIVLNDDNCDNSFFQEVCDYLRKDGFNIQSTNHCLDINQDNCTVVTISQSPKVGSNTIIFAPFNNTRIGHSDSLAIAMYSAFDQNGFLVNQIHCSEVVEQDNEKEYVPTDTELRIDEDKNTSFVTISFGEQKINAEWVAKSIESGLARQKYYLEHYDDNPDLIYRANNEDSVDMVANYFGVDSIKLRLFNKIDSSLLSESQAVVNPDVRNMEVFDRDSLFEVDGIKTKAY